MALIESDFTLLLQGIDETNLLDSTYAFTMSRALNANEKAFIPVLFVNNLNANPPTPTVVASGLTASVVTGCNVINPVNNSNRMLVYEVSGASPSGDQLTVTWSGGVTITRCAVNVVAVTKSGAGTVGTIATPYNQTGIATPWLISTTLGAFVGGASSTTFAAAIRHSTTGNTAVGSGYTIKGSTATGNYVFTEVQAGEDSSPDYTIGNTSTYSAALFAFEVQDASSGLGIPLAMHHYTKNLRG